MSCIFIAEMNKTRTRGRMVRFGDEEVFHYVVKTVTTSPTCRVVNRKCEGGSRLNI